MFHFPYTQVSLLLETAFSRLNSPFSKVFSGIAGGKPGLSQALSWFLFYHGKFCMDSFIFLSFTSPVIGFCLLCTPASSLEPSDSHKGHHSLLALLPDFNELFSYATSSAQTVDFKKAPHLPTGDSIFLLATASQKNEH